MKDGKIFVVAYARVSTDNQLENYSVPEQVERIKAYCKARGWVLLEIITDAGYSGGNTDRPGLQRMLRMLRETHVDAVVVYKLDRLSRSQKDTLTLIEDEFLAHGTDFVSINENFDTTSPFGRAMIGILSVFAQLEKDQITERFTMGRIGRSKAGYFHGGGNPPTGYDYTDGKLEINEYEAIQVQEVFDLFLAGKSINSIWTVMSNKYTTNWTAIKVSNILKNTIYIGKVKFCGEQYDGIHPPIIDPATFYAANALLGSPEREDAKNSAQKTPFRAGYTLSGLVYCGNCGAKYSANHGYYKCYSRAKSSPKYTIDPDCKNDNWEIETLDSIVVAQVEALSSKPSALKSILAGADSSRAVKRDKDKLKKMVKEIDAQIDKLIELYQFTTMPVDLLTRKVNGLAMQRSTLTEQIETPDEPPTQELFLSALEDFQRGFATGDTDTRRLLLSGLIERITIAGQSVKIKWRV